MAHAYSHLFRIPITMLRFFTVYGPWGRPDMALFKFAAALFEGRPIDVYNHGNMKRDFTFVGDLVEAMVRLLAKSRSRPTLGLCRRRNSTACRRSRPGASSTLARKRLSD